MQSDAKQQQEELAKLLAKLSDLAPQLDTNSSESPKP